MPVFTVAGKRKKSRLADLARATASRRRPGTRTRWLSRAGIFRQARVFGRRPDQAG